MELCQHGQPRLRGRSAAASELVRTLAGFVWLVVATIYLGCLSRAIILLDLKIERAPDSTQFLTLLERGRDEAAMWQARLQLTAAATLDGAWDDVELIVNGRKQSERRTSE